MALMVRAIYSKGQIRLLDPVDLPEGKEIKLLIELGDDETDIVLPENLTWEEKIHKMKLAGVLLEPDELDIPEDAVELTPEERDRIGRLFASDRPVEDLIDEDRGEY